MFQPCSFQHQPNHKLSELILTCFTCILRDLSRLSPNVQSTAWINTSSWLAAAFLLTPDNLGCSMWTQEYLKLWCVWQDLGQQCWSNFLPTSHLLNKSCSLINTRASLVISWVMLETGVKCFSAAHYALTHCLTIKKKHRPIWLTAHIVFTVILP